MAPLANAKSQTARRVYSYIRFSTPDQKLGDSERRQVTRAKEWAKRKGFEFDETLKDEGLSGRGTHRTKGKLGLFLQRVKDGRVPNGSVLVVENIDRLSREGASQALRKIIFELWDSDITIQTLSPEEEYAPDCGNQPKFLALLMYLQRAWDESDQKSSRIRAARDSARRKAREDKAILTRRAPAWLTVVDREFQPIPAAARTIKRIFEMRAKGTSVRRIESILNKSAEWKPPRAREKQKTRGWRTSYIQKILSNRAVIGEYQPHKVSPSHGREPDGEPIKGYYPPIVKPATFWAIQERAKERQYVGGQTGLFRNVLRGLVKCAYCGGPLHFVDKGKPPKGGAYLCCESARLKDGCSAPMIRYDECAELILENCPRLRPEQVLPNPSEKTKKCKLLRRRIEGADGELQSIERRLNNFADQIGDAPSPEIRKRYQDKLVDLGNQKQQLTEQRQADASALTRLDEGLRTFTAWTTSVDILRNAIAKGANTELRLRLNSELRTLISKIEVFSEGHERWARFGLRGGESLAEQFEEMMEEIDLPRSRSERFRAFLKYVKERRMSKIGRFLRVHFTSGAIVNLVPGRSIATGLELIDGKEWGRVEPEFNWLWQAFKTTTKRAI